MADEINVAQIDRLLSQALKDCGERFPLVEVVENIETALALLRRQPPPYFGHLKPGEKAPPGYAPR